MSRHTRVVVLVGASMMFLTMGTRPSIGLFPKPVTEDLGTDRESFAGSGWCSCRTEVGAFVGVCLGGGVVDRTGSHDPAAARAVVLGARAAVIHIPIAVVDDRSTAASIAS